MTDAILVLNAGSSSIKFSLFFATNGALELKLRGLLEGLYTSPRFAAKDAAGTQIDAHAWAEGTSIGHDGAIDHLIGFLQKFKTGIRLIAVGHRVVHGGLDYAEPTLVNAAVISTLEKFSPLAPLHQPHNLALIGIVAERMPDMPQIACFDTAFHRAQPELAQAFALPASITDLGVRRYGFHGLSYEFIAATLPDFDARAASGRVVVAHLGNGASMCAMKAGVSVASTMGFTAVEGLVMGTRCGSLDPGVLLYLIDELKMDTRAVEKLIYQQSGLLGVSGVSSDMRVLLESPEPRAKLAVDLFVYRIGRELGSLAAALGGLDAIVFTGGIGEHASAIRERVCRDAAWLGVDFDATANAAGSARVSTASSRTAAWVIPTNEELMIARHTQRMVAGHSGTTA